MAKKIIIPATLKAVTRERITGVIATIEMNKLLFIKSPNFRFFSIYLFSSLIRGIFSSFSKLIPKLIHSFKFKIATDISVIDNRILLWIQYMAYFRNPTPWCFIFKTFYVF